MSGHPLTVQTPNAFLTITGTKFDVMVDDDRTNVVLVEGSLRFSSRRSPEQARLVSAGLTSTIVGQSPPTAPYAVDALPITMWARGVDVGSRTYPYLQTDPVAGRETKYNNERRPHSLF